MKYQFLQCVGKFKKIMKEGNKMDQQLWEKAVQFHGHACPGLAIGVRAATEAIDKMEINFSKDEDIVCVTENDACGVDGVQAILGCTAGKGNLKFRDTGKMAFTFFNRSNGQKLRICLKPSQSDMSREERQAFFLNGPSDDIFIFSEPGFSLPEKARLFTTVACDVCGEGVPEHKMRLENGKKVCLDCFHEYKIGW